MIGLDTNILVRYFVQDDSQQSSLAADVLENRLTVADRGFVSTVVLLELNRVLQTIYGVDKKAISKIILKMLSVPNLVIEASGAVRCALLLQDQSFSDALIHEIGRANGCRHSLTFDRKFARVDGVELVG
jgi:predicted nucleic-acid-binding protein